MKMAAILPFGGPSLQAQLFAERMMEQQRERLEQIAKNWAYYSGFHKKMLVVRRGQPDDNVTINLARLIVDKGVAFLFGKPLVIELQEGETTPEEEWLEQVWQRNQFETLLLRLAIGGGVTGHVFVKIVPSAKQGDPPRLVNIESEYLTVFYAGEDIDDVWRYRIQWEEKSRAGWGVARRQDIERDDAGRWSIRQWIAEGSATWKIDEQHPPVQWQWDWPPMLDCQNLINPGSYYGQSDLEDLSEQDAINYLASKVQRIIRYHQHPRTIGAGFQAKDIKIAVDETLVLPTAESKLWNLEMQSDLGASLAFMDRLTNWFLATARVPRIDPAIINVGAMSGFALRIIYGDLLEKTEVKRRLYGGLLIELTRRLLDMAGKGPEHVATLHWADPLPADEKAAIERDKFERDYELTSVETIQVRRGLDVDAEKERLQAEKIAEEIAEGNVGALILREWETGRGGEE